MLAARARTSADAPVARPHGGRYSLEMIASLMRCIAVVACLVLVASFSLFALDQAGGASQQAQSEAAGTTVQQTDPTSATGQTLGAALAGGGAEHGLRATIDDANRTLLTPVHPFAPGAPNSWGARCFELVGGLLLYGLLLGILARSTALARRRHLLAAAGPTVPPAHF
jgi:hypothetical protein